jgi:RNA-directed DNA polymerase
MERTTQRRAEPSMMNQPDLPSMAVRPTRFERHGHRNLAEKESSCEVTLSDVLSSQNMEKAWKQVKANKGAAGIDGMKIEDFLDFAKENWGKILSKLAEGSYSPSPVRGVQIPKGGGKYRQLGIPTVLDRVIQQAISQVLTPLYEPQFSEHSHGFRPKRSAHGAINEMHRETNKKGTRCHVVDCDLAAFFDTVDHQKLMGKLRESIADPALLKLILGYLKAGVIPSKLTREEREKEHKEKDEGVPQGGPLSPLLANILLDELDHELEKRGHKFVRYADDFVILCRSLRAGKRILQSITKYLADELKLTVNQTKSQVVKLRDASFLGFKIVRRKIWWTEKSSEKFKQRIREVTKRTRGSSPTKVTSELRMYVRGAMNYYGMGMKHAEARDLDSWMRSRMRLYYWKQWGRPRTRRRKLLRLGIGRGEVHKVSRSRKGPWRISHNSIVHRAMTLEWLGAQGLPSIEKQWNLIRYPNGPKRQKG